MRQCNGDGSLRQRSDKLWEKRVYVTNPTTGITERYSVYGKTKTEAIKKAKAKEIEVLTHPEDNLSAYTVEDWMGIWLREFALNIKDATRCKYEQMIRCHIKPTLGSVKLDKLTAIMVQRFYNEKVKDGLSAKTVHDIHGVLHKALEHARRLGYVKKNVSDDCELPTVHKKEIHPIVDDKLKEFLNALDGNPYQDIFYVTIFTGMRKSEAIGLTWDCVDFNAGTIHLYRQLTRSRLPEKKGTYEFISLKNNKSRTFTPASQVMDILRQLRVKQAEQRLKAGMCWNSSSNFVFTDNVGNHLCDASVYENFKRIAKKIGMEDTRFHDLRHTFATLALQNGADIKTVSMSLGHATTAFTMDVYGHVSDAMMKDCSERMSNLIANIE